LGIFDTLKPEEVEGISSFAVKALEGKRLRQQSLQKRRLLR
jgi:hypothetical protein